MLKKCSGLSRMDTGVMFYRLIQPLRFLKRTGICKETRITPFSGQNIMNNGKYKFNDQTLMRITKNADIMWTTLPFSKEDMAKYLNLRKWSGAKWIIDIDDNFFAVTKDNPAQENTRLLHDEIILALTLSDGLTVSVSSLKDLYQKYNPNVFVMPNGIDPLEYQNPVGKHDKVRIGWRGAYGHAQDINLVEDVISHITQDFDVEFVTFGVKPNIKVKNHIHQDWVPFLDYPEKVQSLGYDIAIVPLIDSEYNRCKSNLAVLEYSVMKIPVVASPTENQLNMPIRYGNSNYEWYSHLEALITDAKERKSQGKRQFDFVTKEFNPAKQVEPLAKWFEALPRKEI